MSDIGQSDPRVVGLIDRTYKCPTCWRDIANLPVRPQVASFVALMEAKLRDNDHKGGWKMCTVRYLSRRLGNELKELRGVLTGFGALSWINGRSERIEAIGREAADVANFAMMIADVCGALDVNRARAGTPGDAK